MPRVIRTKKQRRAAIRDNYHFGLRGMTKKKYRAYLAGESWQRTRWARLERAGHACEECGTRDGPLHVHHLHYCSLGRERAEDLKVLCGVCHRKKHPMSQGE